MDLWMAVLLGVVQGLTEFLPISSSAHLILVPWLFGWQPSGLVFDVSLHFGTAVSILTYFWKDWVLLAREWLRGILEGKAFATPPRRLAWYIVLGTVPAIVAGLTLEAFIETHLRSPLVPVFTLVLFGWILYVADLRGRRERGLEQFNLRDAVWIGCSQALALVPGVSRSGVTISMAMFLHLDRFSAARYSFLLSTPVIVGAAVLQGIRLVRALSSAGNTGMSMDWGVLGLGTLAAALSGFLCIRFFLRYVQSHRFTPFVVYRFVLAGLILVLYLLRPLI